jgi:predicted RNA-binding Zn-ribbon protein involved in translation (DUF1610 family)
MTRLAQSPPSGTAARIVCPQCGQEASIKRIEPDPVAFRENHTFQCDECGLPRTYSVAIH